MSDATVFIINNKCYRVEWGDNNTIEFWRHNKLKYSCSREDYHKHEVMDESAMYYFMVQLEKEGKL